ncbi:hypothetical protein ACJD0Z_00140 [Flavobacteriaceae bacterium M23B6Z8]
MSQNLQIIKKRLRLFIKKYHTNELIKGVMLFIGIGVLYLIFISLLENFLWFNTQVRTIIFWTTVGLELVLLVKFIILPALRLFNLRKGLTETEASKILGKHFTDVNDKLLNVIQLSDNEEMSELLKAGIEQKSLELSPIPFTKAVDYRKGFRYAKYACLPLVVLLIFWLSGKFNWFSEGYERMIHYDVAYEPPAPFYFQLLTDSLVAVENTEFVLTVTTKGEVLPEQVQIEIDGYDYVMQTKASGIWQYKIQNPGASGESFRLKAGEVISEEMFLKVLKAPKLVSLDMNMDYPDYIGRGNEVIRNNGNAQVPEGTVVTWIARTKEAEKVVIRDLDTILELMEEDGVFIRNKRMFSTWNYEFVTGSEELPEYETLSYTVDVIKDQFPVVTVQVLRDSVNSIDNYVNIRYSDDYGISSVALCYFDMKNPERVIKETLQTGGNGYQDIITSFPGNRNLKEGSNYQYYIEVKDNDGIHGPKSSRSDLFMVYVPNKDDRVANNLEQQQKVLDKMSDGLEKLNKEREELESLVKEQKQKKALTFNDQRKLEETLKRQSAQQEMMKQFSKELQKNVEKLEESQQDPEKEALLKERLERQQAEMERNERLMEEINKIADKISKEELSKKLEELSKQQQSSERSLEQILELTKRYYVTAKAEKLQKDLQFLSEKQDSLAKVSKGINEIKEQQDLSKRFKEKKEELARLKKENEDLKKPMDLGIDETLPKEVEEDQKNAEDQLQNEKQSEQQTQEKASNKSQKKAANKMRKMSEDMKSSMQSQSSDAMQEDAEMLRQILDNLVLFSFDQESLMDDISTETETGAAFARRLKEQNELRALFSHVDDSLFALSLRRPEISDVINNEITDVYFNIDKALERLSENQIYQGVASQQYVLTAANNLADFLSNVLDNMQDSMGSGSGKSSQGFQLPDIIQSQQQLNGQMKKGMQKGKNGNPSKGEDGKGADGKNNESNNKKGKGEGSEGNNGSKQGDGISEQMSEELFEMYKQQQRIREALEKQLMDKKGTGIEARGKMLLRQMEQVEQDLLERGVTNRVLQRMNNLEYQLLKLENAAQQQGRKDERESITNNKTFDNSVNTITPDVKEYFEQLEILNRQVLPLRQIYKGKVNEYFREQN